MKEPLWDPERVCEFLDLPSPATLHSQRYRGVAPGSLAIKVGRHLRWDPSDLEEWIESQKRPEAITRRTASVDLPTRAKHGRT